MTCFFHLVLCFCNSSRLRCAAVVHSFSCSIILCCLKTPLPICLLLVLMNVYFFPVKNSATINIFVYAQKFLWGIYLEVQSLVCTVST